MKIFEKYYDWGFILIHILGKTQITASLTQTLGNRQNMKINIENIKSSGKF